MCCFVITMAECLNHCYWCYYRTGFDSSKIDYAIEIKLVMTFIGVVSSFMGSLLLGYYHFDFLMFLK